MYSQQRKMGIHCNHKQSAVSAIMRRNSAIVALIPLLYCFTPAQVQFLPENNWAMAAVSGLPSCRNNFIRPPILVRAESGFQNRGETRSPGLRRGACSRKEQAPSIRVYGSGRRGRLERFHPEGVTALSPIKSLIDLTRGYPGPGGSGSRGERKNAPGQVRR